MRLNQGMTTTAWLRHEGAHHDDATTIPFTWNHQKAEAVVTATAGLLNVFEPK